MPVILGPDLRYSYVTGRSDRREKYSAVRRRLAPAIPGTSQGRTRLHPICLAARPAIDLSLPCTQAGSSPAARPGVFSGRGQWRLSGDAPQAGTNLRTGCGCRILDLPRKQHRTTKSFGPSDRRGLPITERAITEALSPGGRGGAVKGKGGAVKGKGVAVKGRGGGPHAASTLAPQRRPHSLQSTLRRHRRLVLLWSFHAPCRHGAGGVRHAIPCRVWRIGSCHRFPPAMSSMIEQDAGVAARLALGR